MSTNDMDYVARQLVTLENQHKSLSRPAQLPSSSVRSVAGEDFDLGDSAENAQDALDETVVLNEDLTEVDTHVDTEAEYSTIVPDWIQNAGGVGDIAWESAELANERVDEAQAAANQAAADALAAAQKAADAERKASEAIASSADLVEGTVFGDEASFAEFWRKSDPDFGRIASAEIVGTNAFAVGYDTDQDPPVLIAESGYIYNRGAFSIKPGETVSVVLDTYLGLGVGNYSVHLTGYAPSDAHDVASVTLPISNPTGGKQEVLTYTNETAEAVNVFLKIKITTTGSSALLLRAATVKDTTAVAHALKEAEAAKFLAEGLFQVIPSTTAPTTSPTGALKQGDQWWKIGTGDTEGKFVGVAVWDGSAWQDRQIVADSVLVPGSVGPVLIEDGAVTASKIAVGALDAKTIHAPQIYGGYIEAPTIASSSELGIGVNKLVDPNFTSTVDSVWVASGHLGDSEVTQVDHITWNQSWSWNGSPTVNKGDVTATLRLIPGTRKTGSLAFANFEWQKTATRNIHNPSSFYSGNRSGGGIRDYAFLAIAVGADIGDRVASMVNKTTYLTNSTPISVVEGERWSVRIGFNPGPVVHTSWSGNSASIQIIDASSMEVLWDRELAQYELDEGQVNDWWVATVSRDVLFRVRATYSNGGGAYATREIEPGSWAEQTGTYSQDLRWEAGSDWYLHYRKRPAEGPTYEKVVSGFVDEFVNKLFELHTAVFAKGAPSKGWMLSESGGLEMFNDDGAKTAQIDGESNFLAGQLSTAESGERWEMSGDSVAFIDNTNAVVGGLIRSGGNTISLDRVGSNSFSSRSWLNTWAAPDGTRAWVTGENREYVRTNGVWAAAGGGGGVMDIVTFSTVGTSTFSKASYPGMSAVRVRLVGAGGAGGDGMAASSNQHTAGGGGGGGGYAESYIRASDLPASVSVTVGRGGRDIGGGTGGAGASTSFGNLVAAGGGGGGRSFNSHNLMIGAIGGAGGSGTSGDIQIQGDGGTMGTGYATLGQGGNGGSSQLGGGGLGRYTGTGGGNTQGDDGGQYGGGGGGGTANAGGSKGRGGYGADGVVIVEIYG